MMKPTRTLFALVCLLTAAPVSAQSNAFNLISFGLGPVMPFTLEIDGNPATTEWAVTTRFGDWWIVNPETMCKSPIATASNPFTTLTNVTRIGGRDHLVVTDLRATDGEQWTRVYRILSPCYPASNKR
jgi:hypothetical protein